jgi:hypothetical protein
MKFFGPGVQERLKMKSNLLSAFAGALLLTSLHCGDSVGNEGLVVGGPCTTVDDCASGSVCLSGGDFPGGSCSVRCFSHEDCPSGTRCIEKDKGVCLVECYEPIDCRGGYTCKGKKNVSGGGESLVCIED